MEITRQSFRLMSSFLIIVLVFLYFIFWYFQTERNLFELSIGIAIFWAILLPVFSYLPYSFSYIVLLPSPIFGAWILIMTLIEKYAILLSYFRLLAFILSLLLVLTFHALTRRRTMFWKIPMASLSRSSIAAVSLIFFVMGIMLVNPSAFGLDITTELFYFLTLLLGYIASSMLYINYSYRLFVLSNRLNRLHLENALLARWREIEAKYPNQHRDIDLLQYYFGESFRCFLEGDFEKSFIWGYKVIREKTVVDPQEYVDDKRADKPSFSEIRNTLEHSRRRGHVDTSKIRQIVKDLFSDCLDLLEREFVFIEKVSESSSPKVN